jgi:hypothetical protein
VTAPRLFAELVATLGLLLVIFSLARTRRGNLAPAVVGAYIGAAHFFTSSTSTCGKELRRKTRSTKMRPHKAPDGWPCPGRVGQFVRMA